MARKMSHDARIKLHSAIVSKGKNEKVVVLRGGKPWGFSVTGKISDPCLKIDKVSQSISTTNFYHYTGGHEDKRS